jgi:hypothetical protein
VTLLNNEIAIPFGVFTSGGGPFEDIDVLSDEIDGGIVAVEPGHSAATMTDPPMHSRAGRVVIAVAGEGAGSSQSADDLVDRLVTQLAEFAGSGHDDQHGDRHSDRHDRQGRHEHHDPADLAFWAEVDAARGRLATVLDIVVCTHYLGEPVRTYVVTVEGPARLLTALLAVTEASPEANRRALLTPAGAETEEPTGSVLLAAAARHAHRAGGRAEVFPGQEILTVDRPVLEVLDHTAIDEVRGTQGPYALEAVLRAYGYVRPSYVDGDLVLAVGHDDPLVVTPWEVRYCRPCCGDADDGR